METVAAKSSGKIKVVPPDLASHRSASLCDCVVSRLRERYPQATGPLVVHRLHLDTSRLLLIAKHADTAKALQRMFSLREIEKHYVAWLDGTIAADHGHVTLPLRVDVDDRPRHP